MMGWDVVGGALRSDVSTFHFTVHCQNSAFIGIHVALPFSEHFGLSCELQCALGYVLSYLNVQQKRDIRMHR